MASVVQCDASAIVEKPNEATRKPSKHVKIAETTMESFPKNSQCCVTASSTHKEENQRMKSELFTALAKDPRKQRIQELLEKERQDEEEREKFVKESLERKAAERAEVINQAKKLILYRKPMCRRINQALLASECFRELDAQIKFRETLRGIDKNAELSYASSMKADVAKYEEEKKRTTEEQIQKQKKYATLLKRQMEENERNTKAKEKEEFEAEKQSLIFENKYLQDAKAHEEEELLNKKHRLKHLFEEAIAEKRRFELKQKYEEEFEDRAIEVYRTAKERIKKMHKKVTSQRKEDIENRAQLISERHRALMQSSEAIEEEILEKALAEKEARRKEQEEARREREIKMRKELQDFRKETVEKKSREVEEEKDWKLWKMMLRFKKAESDEVMDIEERKREWKSKMEYKDSLRKCIMEREAQLKEEKYFEAKEAADMKEIIEKENKRVLDYADEVINESTGVRPLYPILKAVKECKKEMNLLPLQKKEEIMDTKPTRRRRRPRVCTKIVQEEQICYLK